MYLTSDKSFFPSSGNPFQNKPALMHAFNATEASENGYIDRKGMHRPVLIPVVEYYISTLVVVINFYAVLFYFKSEFISL